MKKSINSIFVMLWGLSLPIGATWGIFIRNSVQDLFGFLSVWMLALVAWWLINVGYNFNEEDEN